jgi:hypothetical protein
VDRDRSSPVQRAIFALIPLAILLCVIELGLRAYYYQRSAGPGLASMELVRDLQPARARSQADAAISEVTQEIGFDPDDSVDPASISW